MARTLSCSISLFFFSSSSSSIISLSACDDDDDDDVCCVTVSNAFCCTAGNVATKFYQSHHKLKLENFKNSNFFKIFLLPTKHHAMLAVQQLCQLNEHRPVVDWSMLSQ